MFIINNEESGLIRKYDIDFGWYFYKEYLWDMGWEQFEAKYDRIDTTFYLYLNHLDMDTFRIKHGRIDHEPFFEVYFNGKMAYPGPDSSHTGL